MADDKPPEYFTQGAGYGKLNQWLAWILDHVYIPGDDSITAISGNGTGPGRIFANGGSGGGASGPSPFDILSIDATGQASVYPGTVNQLVPDNLFTPVVFSTSAGVYYLTLQCTSDGRKVTLAHLAAETTAPSLPDATANAAPTAFKVVLAVVVVTSGPVFIMYRVWPKNANVLASIVLALRVSRTLPGPGELGYTPYYQWQVTTDLVIQG